MAQAASSCTAASNNATLGGRATADNAAGSPSRCTSPRYTVMCECEAVGSEGGILLPAPSQQGT